MTARDHDSYLAALPDDQRRVLQTLRDRVRAAAPEAVEVISYGIPAFRLGPRGKVLCGYAAMTAHCGLYFFDGDLVARFKDALAGFSTDKGTVRFTPQKPLPPRLVAKLVSARLDQLGNCGT